jgi:hypothetical protein
VIRAAGREIHKAEKNSYKILGGKMHCGKLNHTEEVTIKFFYGEINSDNVEWIQLARDSAKWQISMKRINSLRAQHHYSIS